MAPVTHDGVVDIFGVRFDSWSATAVLEEMLSRAGVPVAATYAGPELARLADALEERRGRDRIEQVVALLRQAASTAKTAPAPAPVSTAPVNEDGDVKAGRLEAPRPAAAAKASKRTKKAEEKAEEA